MSSFEEAFPGLRDSGYDVTSPKDKSYNCIAWAAGESGRWWQPDPFDSYYWPSEAPLSYAVDAYQAAFASHGYEVCDSTELEMEYEKIALFSDTAGNATHATRQLPSGRWTSKLGPAEDIEHELRALEGRKYGQVSVILKRKRRITRGAHRGRER